MIINGVKVNHICYGKMEAKDTIVLLHGWGQNIEMMRPVGDAFSTYFKIVILDLPGYGKSSEPPFAWSIYDYTDFIYEFLKKLKIENPILIGHSFGGKISLEYASKYECKKLVLFASPFKKEFEKQPLKVKILKQMKKIPGLNKLESWAKKHVGSTDYRNASPLMREVLVKTVNLDITNDVKKILCPTLIFWGTLDSAVNISSAYELEKYIADAGLIVYEGCTHYAYLERLGNVIVTLKQFFGVR